MNLHELKSNKAKFFPKMNEKYSFVDTFGRVITIKNQDDLMDRWLIKHYPVFRTEKEAEDYLHYLDLLFEYCYEFSRDEWKDNYIGKWFIKYDYHDDRLIIAYNLTSKCLSHYFISKKVAQDFIEEAGAENIKKFMFDVWN